MQDSPAPALSRSMGAVGALLITLSGLSPSIGVFVVGSEVIRAAGSAALFCFLAAALLGVAIANVYAELASALPEAGGEYTIVGRVLGPSWGFAMLGLNLLTFSIGPAVTALGVVDYLRAALPGLPQVPTAMMLVAICMGVAILNVRLNAWITGAFLAVELASLAALAWLGFAHVRPGAAAAVLHPVMLDAAGRLGSVPLAALGVGAAGAIYAFDGYGSAVYLGEEFHDAPRRMARVVFLAFGAAALFMTVPLLAVLLGAPDLKALIAAPSPTPDFIASAGGPGLAKVMSLGIALALFNAMIAIALMGGRHLYASGRDRAWPSGISTALSRLHGRFGSPWVATLALGLTGVLWCALKPSVLLMLLGDGTAAIYGCMCLAALKARGGVAARAPYRMPLFPWMPVLALAGLAGVGLADLFDADGRKGLLASAVVIALSAVCGRLARRPGGAWRHRGPGAEPAA